MPGPSAAEYAEAIHIADMLVFTGTKLVTLYAGLMWRGAPPWPPQGDRFRLGDGRIQPVDRHRVHWSTAPRRGHQTQGNDYWTRPLLRRRDRRTSCAQLEALTEHLEELTETTAAADGLTVEQIQAFPAAIKGAEERAKQAEKQAEKALKKAMDTRAARAKTAALLKAATEFLDELLAIQSGAAVPYSIRLAIGKLATAINDVCPLASRSSLH
jgi:hypothetical protein